MKATRIATVIVGLCAATQLALLFYSISHPSFNDWVTASFVFTIVIYPLVFAYHTTQMKKIKSNS